MCMYLIHTELSSPSSHYNSEESGQLDIQNLLRVSMIENTCIYIVGIYLNSWSIEERVNNIPRKFIYVFFDQLVN